MCNRMGSVVINPHEQESFMLTNVLFVPHFTVNLMSVRRIVNTGAYVVCKDDQAHIVRNNTVENIFNMQSNLWTITSFTSTSSSFSSTSSSSRPAEATDNQQQSITTSPGDTLTPIADKLFMMHLRFGHANYNRLIHADDYER
jgi:hypothetical protein